MQARRRAVEADVAGDALLGGKRIEARRVEHWWMKPRSLSTVIISDLNACMAIALFPGDAVV